MNLIRFFIPLLLIGISTITSCKKNDPGQSGLVDSSKTLPSDEPDKPIAADSSNLLPSVIYFYNTSDSLLTTNYYSYDNGNKITKLVAMARGATTNSKTFGYDANGNLTNITELSPHISSILTPGINPGTAIFDTTNYVVHYTNNVPDSTIVTGSAIRKKVIKYVIENNKISTIKTFTYTETSIGIIGVPPNRHIDSIITRNVYTGDDLIEINESDGKIELNYNTHKSAFYSLNVKWPLITESGFIVLPKIFTKYDVVKIAVPFGPGSISYNYVSLYNKYDYPTETQSSGMAEPGTIPNGSALTITPLKMKYQYVLAK